MITVTLQSEVNKPNINGHIYTESAMQSILDILNSKEIPVYKTGDGTPIAKTVIGSGKLVDGKIVVEVDMSADEKPNRMGFGCYDIEEMDYEKQEVKKVEGLGIRID
jgi:hypothetical protein